MTEVQEPAPSLVEPHTHWSSLSWSPCRAFLLCSSRSALIPNAVLSTILPRIYSILSSTPLLKKLKRTGLSTEPWGMLPVNPQPTALASFTNTLGPAIQTAFNLYNTYVCWRNKWFLFCLSGFCGADIKALCVEAGLCALRRRYPQIHESDKRLKIDARSIKVTAKDFATAMQKIVPASQRAGASPGRALPAISKPLLENTLERILQALQRAFPHASFALKKSRGITITSNCLKSCQSRNFWFLQPKCTNFSVIMTVQFHALCVHSRSCVWLVICSGELWVLYWSPLLLTVAHIPLIISEMDLSFHIWVTSFQTVES